MPVLPLLPTTVTVLSVVPGGFALARYARLVSRSTVGPVLEPRAVELLHLLMAVGMIAMAWSWSGGPSTGSGIAELIVFGLFAVGFGARALVVPIRRLPRLFHAATALSMVWMVVAMPVLMAPTAGMTDIPGMPDMTDMPGVVTGGGPGAGTTMGPTSVRAVTACFAVAMTAAAVAWAVAAARGVDCAPDGRPAVPARPAPEPVGTPGVRAPAEAPTTGDASRASTASPAPPSTPPPVVDRPRLVASCHLLMSAGMAAMLVAML